MTVLAWRMKRRLHRGKKLAIRSVDDLLALLAATAILCVLLAG